MLRIAYLSACNHAQTTEEISTILDVSRRNNTRDGITGMLLCKDNYYLQILEGEEPTVLSCYRRIAADPRHSEIEMIYHRQAKSRAFSNWAMAFARPRDLPSHLAPIARDLLGVAERIQHSDISDMTLEKRAVARLMRSFLDDWRGDNTIGQPKLFEKA